MFGDSARHGDDPSFRDRVLFYKYFHGDTGRGIGAAHQTAGPASPPWPPAAGCFSRRSATAVCRRVKPLDRAPTPGKFFQNRAMQDRRRLCKLAACYRKFAEGAGNPWRWKDGLKRANDWERQAADLEAQSVGGDSRSTGCTPVTADAFTPRPPTTSYGANRPDKR